VNQNDNQIWKTQEDNMDDQDIRGDDSLQSLAKAGLWILKGSTSQPNLRQQQQTLPITDRIKNHYNSTMFNKQSLNMESTNASDNFDRGYNSGSNQSSGSSDLKTPTFNNTVKKVSPRFSNTLKKNITKTQNSNQLGGKGKFDYQSDRFTFNNQ